MTRDAYKALMQHSLRLKQALTPFTDLSNLQKPQIQAFKDLLEAVNDAANNFQKERKSAMKKPVDRKSKEAGLRVDKAGIEIYNMVEELSAGRARSNDPGEIDVLLAQIRLAAHRIIASADEGYQDENSLIRRLDLVTATSVHLTKAGLDQEADEVLFVASDLEDALDVSPTRGDEGPSESAVLSIVNYYLGRVDVAIKQPHVGCFFADKAINLIKNHSVPTAKWREVATKCWEVGEDIRTQGKAEEPESLTEAIGWLYRSSNLVEWLQKQVQSVSWVKKLNVAIHRSLVRCHLVLGVSDRDALEKAKALFFDLTKLVDSRDPEVGCESGIFNLRILQMSGAPAAEINSCVNSLLSQLVWSNEVVEELLAAFAYRDDGDDISGEALKCLFETAQSCEEGVAFSHDVLLAFFTFLRSYAKSKVSIAMKLASSGIDLIANSGDLRHLEAALPACETMIWGLGDHFSGSGQDEVAAHWYELALQPVFQRGDLPANQHIIRRKAALCYIQSQQLAKALEILRPCPQDQAATQYLNFLVALYQNKDSAAIQAIDNLCRCPDLQSMQLQLVVSMADEVQNKPVLMKALANLSNAVKDVKVAQQLRIEAFTVIRTLVRLLISELSEDSEVDAASKVETLIQHLNSAHDLFIESSEPDTKINDLVWLYKSALNIAIKGSETWPTKLTAEVFDKAVQLMEDYSTLDRSRTDDHLVYQMASGQFAAVSGKIFEYRDMEQGDDKAFSLVHLQGYLLKCRDTVERALQSGPDLATLPQMEKMLDVYHVELCCEDDDWENLDTFTKEVISWPQSPDRTETLEMIMDIAARYDGCPSSLSWQLNGELHKSASLKTPQDIARYARSTRALLTSQAQDKTAEQRMIKIMDHAISVLQGPVGEQGQYPEDEGVWLLSTAFNRGLDCFDEEDLEGARLWNDIAKDLCAVIRAGNGFRTRINEQKECIAKLR